MFAGTTAPDRQGMVGTRDWDALLRQAPPRSVPDGLRARALHGERHWQVSLVLTAIVCALLAAAFFPWAIVDDIRLDLGGTAARGVVIDSVYANRTLGDNVVLRKRLVFQVRFRFEDGRAREYEATCLFLGRLAPGTVVDIAFLASDPTVARVRDGFFVPGGLWEVLWSLAFSAPPLFGLWNYRRWRRRRLALLVHGLPASGVIVRAWRDDADDETRGWIVLRYATPDGPVRLDKMVEEEVYRRARAIVEREAPMRLLYAPQAPREPLVVELMP